jgi:hypothetical protein
MRRAATGISLLLVLAGGCSNDATIVGRSSCFDACAGTLSDGEIQARLDIYAELQASLSGALAASGSFASSAPSVTGLIEAMVTGSAGLPGGYTYDGAGVISASPAPQVRLEVRYYLGADTSFGKAGDLITFNVFDPASYFEGLGVKTNIKVSASGVSSELQFTFTKLGPGAELLGLGAATPSPFPVDIGALTSGLGKLAVGGDIIVARQSGPSRVSFRIQLKPTGVGAVGGATAPFVIEGFAAGRTDLGQTLLLDAQELSLVSGSGALDGQIELSSSSAANFSFKMLLSYPSSPLPDIAFGCPDAKLTPP